MASVTALIGGFGLAVVLGAGSASAQYKAHCVNQGAEGAPPLCEAYPCLSDPLKAEEVCRKECGPLAKVSSVSTDRCRADRGGGGGRPDDVVGDVTRPIDYCVRKPTSKERNAMEASEGSPGIGRQSWYECFDLKPGMVTDEVFCQATNEGYTTDWCTKGMGGECGVGWAWPHGNPSAKRLRDGRTRICVWFYNQSDDLEREFRIGAVPAREKPFWESVIPPRWDWSRPKWLGGRGKD